MGSGTHRSAYQLAAIALTLSCRDGGGDVGTLTSSSAYPSTYASASSSVTSRPRLFPEMAHAPTASAAVIAGGKALFAQHCASCHQPEHGFGDPRALSPGATRHTPTLYNVGYQPHFGWDGRDTRLEARVEREFQEHAGIAQVSADDVAAVSAYVRTIVSGDAPFDEFEAGDSEAVGQDVKRGHHVFRSVASCSSCHVPPLYTDHQFHNTGIEHESAGRRAVTGKARDQGRFKTPTLRSITRTAPYFHDGRAATLEQAVDLMLAGGIANPNLDSGLTKIVLTAEQKRDLIAFLRSLDPGGAPP